MYSDESLVRLIPKYSNSANKLTLLEILCLYPREAVKPSGSLPLWIVRKGPGGGEELEASSNLTIKNKDTVSGVSLYTNAIYGIGNNVSLVFTPSAGTKNKDMKIQIFGYKE